MENQMENKVIGHLARYKVFYFMAIALLGVGGIATLDLGSSSNPTLRGDLDQVFNESPLTLTSPPEGAKFVVGDQVKLTWNYPQAQAVTTYRVFVQRVNNQETVLSQGELTGSSFVLEIPSNVLNAGEEAQSFRIGVSVEGTSIENGVTVSVVKANFIPAEKEEIPLNNVAEGENIPVFEAKPDLNEAQEPLGIKPASETGDNIPKLEVKEEPGAENIPNLEVKEEPVKPSPQPIMPEAGKDPFSQVPGALEE